MGKSVDADHGADMDFCVCLSADIQHSNSIRHTVISWEVYTNDIELNV